MDAFQFSDAIEDLLDDLPEDAILRDEVKRTSSFEQKGVLTKDAGLIVTMKDGTEFQITVVRSRREQE